MTDWSVGAAHGLLASLLRNWGDPDRHRLGRSRAELSAPNPEEPAALRWGRFGRGRKAFLRVVYRLTPGRRQRRCTSCFEIGSRVAGSFVFVEIVSNIIQLVVAIGILNVWVVRYGKTTPYRGGDAKSLREEFAAYGLPFWFFCLVGILKVGLALSLIAAIWIHGVAQPAAVCLGLLMMGALAMHFKVGDKLKKSMPAAAMLTLCLTIALLSLGSANG